MCLTVRISVDSGRATSLGELPRVLGETKHSFQFKWEIAILKCCIE